MASFSDVLMFVISLLVAIGLVFLFVLFCWGVAWKLLLSHFGLMRALVDSNEKPSTTQTRHTRTRQTKSDFYINSNTRSLHNR
uniref:Small integral membrane protein 13 n=1 Tax=Amphimedon queenslandica TaxID=400682 RepID=A0A1X7UMJ2_AMPQE